MMEHFSSHTVNTLSLFDLENKNNHKNNIGAIKHATNNTNFYENHRSREPVKSTELTQNLDPLNTTLPLIPKINTPLPHLKK